MTSFLSIQLLMSRKRFSEILMIYLLLPQTRNYKTNTVVFAHPQNKGQGVGGPKSAASEDHSFRSLSTGCWDRIGGPKAAASEDHSFGSLSTGCWDRVRHGHKLATAPCVLYTGMPLCGVLHERSRSARNQPVSKEHSIHVPSYSAICSLSVLLSVALDFTFRREILHDVHGIR